MKNLSMKMALDQLGEAFEELNQALIDARYVMRTLVEDPECGDGFRADRDDHDHACDEIVNYRMAKQWLKEYFDEDN